MHIVFDIGGSKIRVASSRDGRNLTEPIIVRTPSKPEEGIKKLVSLAKDISGDTQIKSVVGGLPGVLNETKTELLAAVNLPNWAGFPVAQTLAEALNCPAKLDNDAVLGAIGEANYGAGQGYQSVVYIAVGTGLGGAWVVDGKIPTGSSTEPGHQIIDYRHGADWEHLVDSAPSPRDQVYFLAIGLLNTLLHWPADIVVFGGGKTFHKTWSVKQISDELEKITAKFFPIPKIVVAKLGDQAGLFGALHLSQK